MPISESDLYQITDETIKLNKDNSSASITLLVPYTDAIDYAQEMLGGLRTAFGTVQFFIGAQFPRSGLGLFVTDCDIKPLKDFNTDFLDWETAVVTLSYGKLDQPQEEDGTEIGDIEIEVAGEEMTLPREGVEVNGEALPESAPTPIKIVPILNLTVSYKRKPDSDISTYVALAGKVNSTTFEGYGAGQVLYQGTSVKRSVTTDGNDQYSNVHKFQIRPNGWNYVWLENAWVELDDPSYLSAEFNGVF